MIDNRFYEVLDILPSATDEEVEERYRKLKERYSEERFLEGEAGNIAARKLTELETAYQEIMTSRRQFFSKEKAGDDFLSIEAAIKAGNLQLAQNKLDAFDQRTGEWHYLQSVVYYKKNWINESKKQLEIACNMEPDNVKFKEALKKMEANVNNQNNYSNNKNWNKSGGAQYGNRTYEEEVPQMGNTGCLEWCCEMAICNLMLNCLCSSCR